MADVEASVRDLVNRDCDCAEHALVQIDLRRKLNLLIEEWKAAGGGDALPDVRGRMRLRAVTKDKPASILVRS
ncbi:hypothetical protein LPJ38_15750 [Bradyrhizobium daqingense]|uniref:Uncharacterized protein n=1 Tax=Bradyrhizobium daqingense TaxID=993502 RepID=A0A562L927_9BRAD|nr:hypothetical protein [Bradyrhizobium daqingense]TWI04177.1 hypothetical protein IQ17_04035 [Bradyrhizobium daqingense]UFS92115.1 hypothetical protein LPJ38_15750 [Bradyrhizobium daqingense]